MFEIYLDKEEKGSELWEIINSIKELEKAVIEYRRFSYYGSISSNNNSKENPSHLDPAIQQEEDLKTKLQEKINPLKEESQTLEKEKDKLEAWLIQAKIDYYKIKEELTEKENNLLLFKEQNNNEEFVKILKQEITTSKENLSTTKEEINEIKKQLTRNKLARLENWIKNFRNVSWSQKISQSLGMTWDGTKYCTNRVRNFFTIPVWYWEQWKNRKNVLVDENWKNIHPSFTLKFIQSWTNHGFTLDQARDWINVGLQPTDADFAVWLRDIREVNPEWVLNHGREQDLKQEFKVYLESKQNNSSAQLLEDKNTSQPTLRKRTISNSKENRPSQEIYELVDLQSREELQTQIEQPPR